MNVPNKLALELSEYNFLCISYFLLYWGRMPDTHNLRQETFILAHSFVEISLHSCLAPKQGGIAEGHRNGDEAHGIAVGSREMLLEEQKRGLPY